MLSASVVQGQKKEETKSSSEKKEKNLTEAIHVKFKEGIQPLVIVDGKKFDFPVDLIDSNKIATVSVVKGEVAKTLYNAPNGAVIIVTKAGEKIEKDKMKSKNVDATEVFSNKKVFSYKKPLIIIDGKVSTEKELNKLKTYNIEKIDVIKGKVAKEKYNAENGVILITTKKRK